jgi:hypothetical protein
MAKKKSDTKAKKDTPVEEYEDTEDYSDTPTEDQPPRMEPEPMIAPPAPERTTPGEESTMEKSQPEAETGKLPPESDDKDRVLSLAEVEANQRILDRKGDTAPQQPIGESGANMKSEPRGDHEETAEQEYIIARGKIGPFVYGQRVARSKFRKGTDVDALVRSGALSVVAPSK